ncbi:hypothetical protein CRE_31450 [Caenorhabditis remanei]|uniref:Uncharacterized protein n=1 Tax=Caenorhabditis remanei TaxID=31234 RepID=E3NAB9_CAERE|nr:hypothetical protein CRE_31450 [Caenorhabditis remanei]
MRVHTVFLISWIFFFPSNASNLIEDITDKEDASNDDHLQTFPTPPPIGTTTSTADALFTRMNEILRKEDKEKSQNFQVFTEKDLVANSNTNPYFSTTRKPKNRSDSSQKARDPDSQHNQVIAGIPDLSDPCFRRYENSIIVCDLFAHVGDQAPARLLKFQTRDYFEPTDIVHCLSLINSVSRSTNEDSDSEEISPPSPPPSAPIIALATNTDKRDEDETESVTTEKIEDITVSSTSTEISPDDNCPRGKQSTFLRTEGFELFKHDEQEMVVDDVAECAKACIENKVSDFGTVSDLSRPSRRGPEKYNSKTESDTKKLQKLST